MLLSKMGLRIGLLVLLVNCSNHEPVVSVHKANFKILFIGNSLTQSNDLPGLVKEIGALDGITIATSQVLVDDYSLEDHWNDGIAQKQIKDGEFDFVVGQQGPSALKESQVLLIEYSKRFAQESKKKDAKFALYMVWPWLSRSFDLDNVIYSYTEASKASDAILCPAGLAWKRAWKEDNSLSLYSDDDFHPSIKGSVLAALTVYISLFDKINLDFITLEKTSWRNKMSVKELDLLKRSALRARKG